MPKPFVQIMWFMLNTCSPSVILEFWYVLDTWGLHDQPAIKTSGTESLMSPLVGTISRAAQFDAG